MTTRPDRLAVDFLSAPRHDNEFCLMLCRVIFSIFSPVKNYDIDIDYASGTSARILRVMLKSVEHI